MEPGATHHGREILQYAFGANSNTQIIPYLAPESGTASPSQQWHAYADKHPWIATSALVALVLAFSIWSRRSELAVYRAFGTPRSVIAGLISLETALIVIPATAVAILLTITISAISIGAPLGTDTVGLLLRTLASTALLGFALGTPLALIATKGRVTDQLKDR